MTRSNWQKLSRQKKKDRLGDRKVFLTMQSLGLISTKG